MRRISKVCVAGLLMSVLMVQAVFAGTLDARATSYKLGTEGTYKVTGSHEVSTPIFGSCSMETSGNALLTYKAKGTGYSKKLVFHEITISTTGLGGLSLSGSGADASISTEKDTISANTCDWDFFTTAEQLRMYSYKQIHRIQYDLQKKNKNGKKKSYATVDLGTKFKWGF